MCPLIRPLQLREVKYAIEEYLLTEPEEGTLAYTQWTVACWMETVRPCHVCCFDQ